MSLYNMIMGRHPLASFLLAAAALTPDEVDRIRDVYLAKEGEEIIVMARIGGGNRADHQKCIDYLRARPNFLRDWDDDFDSTFAYFAFNPAGDEELVPILKLAFQKTNNTPPMERFRQVIADMEAGKDTPEVKKAIQVGKEIFGQIMNNEVPPGHTGIVANETGSVVIKSFGKESDDKQ